MEPRRWVASFPKHPVLIRRLPLVVRLEWVHAAAAAARWREELVLLREESRRVALSFRLEEGRWVEKAGKEATTLASQASQQGFNAYCYRQAAIYGKLAGEAEHFYGLVVQHPVYVE